MTLSILRRLAAPACALLLAGCAGLTSTPDRSVPPLDPLEKAQTAFFAGQLADDAGRLEEAADWYRRAMAYDPDSITLRRNLVSVLIRLGREQEAVEAFRDVFDQSEAGPKVHYLMGQLHEAAGDTRAAEAVYRRSIREKRASAEIRTALGLLYLKGDRRRQGVRHLDRALAMDPTAREARRTLIQVRRDQGDWEAAASLARAGLEHAPGDEEWLLALAEAQDGQGRRKQAEATVHELLLYHPGSIEGHRRLSEFYLEDRKWPLAARELEWLVRVEPDNPVLRRNLGLALFELGQLEEARAQLKLLIEARMADALTHYLMGSIYKHREFHRLAAHEFERAVALKPDFIEAYLELGHVLLEIGDTGRATAVIESAGVRIGDRPHLLSRYGVLLLKLKSPVRALEALSRAVKAEPDNARLRFHLGRAYFELGQFSSAVQAWRKAIQLDPNYAQAYNFLGYLHAERGENLDQAERWIRTALKLKPDDGNYLDSMGWVLYQKKRYAEALTYLQRSLRILQESQEAVDPTIYDHLAETYLQLDRPHEAVEAWEKYLELEPSRREIQERLERLRRRLNGEPGRP